MIKARVTARAGGHDTAARDDAIRFLIRDLKAREWDGWSKTADIVVARRRDGSGTHWLASTTVVLPEDKFNA